MRIMNSACHSEVPTSSCLTTVFPGDTGLKLVTLANCCSHPTLPKVVNYVLISREYRHDCGLTCAASIRQLLQRVIRPPLKPCLQAVQHALVILRQPCCEARRR